MRRQDVVKHSHGKIYGETGYNSSVYVTTVWARYENYWSTVENGSIGDIQIYH